jgi:riboflavin synthase alpha subunit
MRANGHVVRGHEIPAVSNVLHAVKEWAREHVTQEKIAEACVVAGSFALAGYLLLVLHVAMQNRTIAGF